MDGINQTQPTMLPEPKKKVWLWVVIAIVVILALGAAYYYYYIYSPSLTGGQTEGVEPALGTSDEVQAIENDLNATNLDNLDSDLDAIEKEL
jgi:flagellar basal body-associated protein FliL